MRLRIATILLALTPVIAGCSSHSIGSGTTPGTYAESQIHSDGKGPASKLKHIVIIIQENRTVDNLFNGFCTNGGTTCANTVTVDPVSGTPLVSQSLAGSSNPNHAHNNFLAQFDKGKMDGFGKQAMPCKGPPPCTVFSYVPATEVQSSYWALASSDGVLSDATFETPQGPSLPSHYYAIAGQSGGYDDDHWAIEGGSGSCKTTALNAEQILMTSGQQGNKITPCKDFPTIFDSLATAGHSWRYYTNSPQGFWSVPENIQHLYGSPNIVIPSTQFLSDVANNTLADVTYVAPKSGAYSDHPGMVKTWCYGPDWVAQVVNAVGQSPYWNNTAIVLFWDDWGGWYDHVIPPASPLNPDPFEYGFRVPLIVISPYATVGNIDHTTRTYVSVLRLIEEAFKVPSLGTTDQYEPDGLDSMFNFKQKPIKYTPIDPPTGTSCTGSGARPFRSFGSHR